MSGQDQSIPKRCGWMAASYSTKLASGYSTDQSRMSAPYPTQEKSSYASQQDAYPTQPSAPSAYPPPPYPPSSQGPYPSQPQGAYPPQAAYPQEPPPYQPTPQGQPYYSAQQTENVVVVNQQPAVLTHQVQRPEREVGLGIGAIVFGVFSTVFLASFGCWWALPCTFVGCVLGIISTTTGDSGDSKTAKTHGTISIVCTGAGWFAAIAGIVIIIVSIVAAVNSNN